MDTIVPTTMGRRPHTPDTSTYSGLVAARLRELRVDRGWSVADVVEAFRAEGHENIGPSHIYAYEKGRVAGKGGVDIPLELIPVVASIFGFKSAAGWLPKKWPDRG